METSKAVVSVSTPSETLPHPEPDSRLSVLLYDVSQEVQMAMENMLKMIGEIDQSFAGIMEDIKKCKEFAIER